MTSDKEFIKKFENNVKQTIKKFSLINKKDKILVAVSGGKDSTVILYLLKKIGYKVEAITIDVLIGNYTKQNRINVEKFCKEQDIKLHIVSFRDQFKSSVCHITALIKAKGINLMTCTVCGVLRRYLINRFSRKTGATKVVTGHNIDDEAQAIMMNWLKNKLEMCARLGPMPGLIRDKKFVPRIKPLYLTSEKDVEKYSKIMKFPVKYGRCPCAVDAYRNHIRNMLNILENDYPSIKLNIVNFFLKIRPKLQKKFQTKEKLNKCTECKEPSKSKICRACQILSFIKHKS